MAGAPLQFDIASAIRLLVPEQIPGVGRAITWLRDLDRSERMVEGTAFRGLRYRGPLRGMCTFATYRWSAPALAPIFDAVLERGGVLADVGGFMGLYAMWGARRVGPRGKVYTFEPVAASIAQLETNLEINGFDNVEIVNAAVGAEPGEIELQLAEGRFALGISSRYLVQARPETTLKVEQITLDEFFRDREPPDLIKVDVEGMEPEVFRGAQQLMESDAAPVVVFEAQAAHLEAAGAPYPEVLRFFDQRGYGVWAPQRRGIRREPLDARTPGCMNVLGTRLDLERHRQVLERLERARFLRNQNE